MEKRVLGMRMAAVGAILLLTSVATKLWWSGVGIGMGLKVGPLGAEACGGLGCAGFDMGQIGGGAWQAVGYLMFIAGLGASVLGLSAVWSAWTRRRIGSARLDLNKMVLRLGAASIVCAIAFAATRPSEAMGLSMGVGLFLAVIGAGLLVGAALVLRQVGRADTDGAASALGAAALAAAAVPHGTACTRCGAPMRWIPEYSRFWCDREQIYV